jgi:hypothetical protein
MAQMAKKKPTKRRRKQISRGARLLALIRKILESWWARSVTFVALIAAVMGTYAPLHDLYYETIPDVHPSASSSDIVSYSLPFSLRNRSLRFDMSNAALVCEFTNVTWDTRSAPGTPGWFRVIGSVMHPVEQKDFVVETNRTINFPCDARDAVKASDSESHADFPVGRVTVRVRVNYRTRFNWFGFSFPRTEFVSSNFTWQKSGSGFQWFEGEVIR